MPLRPVQGLGETTSRRSKQWGLAMVKRTDLGFNNVKEVHAKFTVSRHEMQGCEKTAKSGRKIGTRPESGYQPSEVNIASVQNPGRLKRENAPRDKIIDCTGIKAVEPPWGRGRSHRGPACEKIEKRNDFFFMHSVKYKGGNYTAGQAWLGATVYPGSLSREGEGGRGTFPNPAVGASPRDSGGLS